MARILLAWELGAGVGHLLPLAEAGRELAAAGHECAYALRDLGNAHAFFDARCDRLYQAPLFLPSWRAENDIAYTFADILANIGYRQPGPLTGLLAGWRSIYEDFKPDLIVFDHAPTAQAAARGLGIPAVIVARSGFTLPPAVSPLPALRPMQGGEQAAARERETRLLETLNAALQTMGIPSLQSVGELYNAEARILFSVPELDPYSERDDVEYWGPLEHAQGRKAEWPLGNDRPKVFAYLRKFPTLNSLLETLNAANCVATLHVAGMSAEECARRSNASLHFSPDLLDVRDTLRECDLVITHGGSLVALALLAGKPMLTLPLHLEQQSTAMRVEAMGAGLNAPRLAPDGMRAKVMRLLNEPAFGDAARRFASRHPEYPAPMNGRFAALVERLL